MQEGFNLTIIAFYGHYNILHCLLHLLDHPKISLHIFTSDKDISSLTRENARITVIYSPDQLAVRTLKKHESTHRRSDHILVLTLFKNFRYYTQLASTNSLSFLIHNTHFAFGDKKYKLQGIIRWNNLKMLLQSLRVSHKFKKEILTRADALFFLSASTLNYARNNYPEFPSKMRLLPYRYQIGQTIAEQNRFRIIVPGGINMEHRDYQYLYKWLHQVKKTKPIEIVFPGKSDSTQVKKLRNDIGIDHLIEIITFTHYVNQSDYNLLLKSTNVILAPLNLKVTFQAYYEFYGLSKITGAVNDAIRFNIPLILPFHYQVEEGIQTYYYDDESSFYQIMNGHYQGEISSYVIERNYQFTKVQGDLISAVKSIIAK